MSEFLKVSQCSSAGSSVSVALDEEVLGHHWI